MDVGIIQHRLNLIAAKAWLVEFFAMKKCILIWGWIVLAVIAKADPEFTKSLSAEDVANAGLQKLTPAELARLDGLVQRYKTGQMADSHPQNEAKADETVIKTKEGGGMVANAPVDKQPSWFTALIAINHAGERPDKEEPLKSRLVGDFDGWNGRSIFKLENGTRWLQQNKTETYIYAPTLHSPKVKITPASIRGFWLEIEGVNLRVRVMPLDLPEPK